MFSQYIENVGRTSGGLAISGGTGAVVATANTTLFTIGGKLYSKGAADLAALTGMNIADLYTNIITVYLDYAGTATYGLGQARLTAGLSTNALSDIQFADKNNASKAIIGYIVITNATGAVFTGGTTALDAVGLTVTFIDMANASLAV